MGTVALHHHRRHLHADPPVTLRSVLFARRRLLLGLVALLVVFAVAAVVENGYLLLTWDKPIQQTVESRRTPFLNEVFLAISRLGSTPVVLTLGAIGVLVTWSRCRAVSMALAVATLTRPGFEYVFKALVDRDRPNLNRLVSGDGPSFPSGHVLASAALWGMLPVVVSLYTQRRRLWWVASWLSMALIVAIAASRVYLGVHWFTDVTAGLVAGAFFLVFVEAILGQGHRLHPCRLLVMPGESPASQPPLDRSPPDTSPPDPSLADNTGASRSGREPAPVSGRADD
jgi:undecaprenyl-diphosphatase